MIYCIDIDDTLCYGVEDDYAHSQPAATAITRVNKLYDEGHTIKLFTGRGSWDNADWREFTKQQLTKWGVKYHELIMGKPAADVFIDDKAVNTTDWLGLSGEMQSVERGWGKEIWIVNCDEYCSKLLYLPRGAYSEYHFHKLKKETFYCLRGIVQMTIDGQEGIFDQFSKPITLQPGTKHLFKGMSNAILLEVSTHHSDDDVVFLSQAFRPDMKENFANSDSQPSPQSTIKVRCD